MGRDRIKELNEIFDSIFTSLQNDDFDNLDTFFKKIKDINLEDLERSEIPQILKKIEAVKSMIEQKQKMIISSISKKENIKHYK
ncbi:hypothetical protein [Persephonella sp.]